MHVSGLSPRGCLSFPYSSTQPLLCTLLVLLSFSPLQVEHYSQCCPYCCRYICTAFAVACIFYDSMQVSDPHGV